MRREREKRTEKKTHLSWTRVESNRDRRQIFWASFWQAMSGWWDQPNQWPPQESECRRHPAQRVLGTLPGQKEEKEDDHTTEAKRERECPVIHLARHWTPSRQAGMLFFAGPSFPVMRSIFLSLSSFRLFRICLPPTTLAHSSPFARRAPASATAASSGSTTTTLLLQHPLLHWQIIQSLSLSFIRPLSPFSLDSFFLSFFPLLLLLSSFLPDSGGEVSYWHSCRPCLLAAAAKREQEEAVVDAATTYTFIHREKRKREREKERER